MAVPPWLLQLGSIAGLGSLAFLLIDRLMAGRPLRSIRRTGYQTRDLYLVNTSPHDILIRKIRTYPKNVRVAASDSVRSIVDSHFEPFSAILKAGDVREFPLLFNRGELLDKDCNERAPFLILISWRRMGSSWMPQVPVIMLSSAKSMRLLNSAK